MRAIISIQGFPLDSTTYVPAQNTSPYTHVVHALSIASVINSVLFFVGICPPPRSRLPLPVARPREGFLTDLARANVQFDVLFEDRIGEENLRRYACVVVYEARLLSDEALGALARHSRQGGRMIVYGRAGVMNRWGQPRANNPLRSSGPWETAPDEATILKFIRDNTDPSFEVIDCPYVLFTITEGSRSAGEGFVVRLLNYQKRPLEDVRVRCPGGEKLQFLALAPDCERLDHRGGADWVIPKLGVYSILIAKR